MTTMTDAESQSTAPNASDYVVETTAQNKHYIELPDVHLAAAGIEQGDSVGIKPINFNGKFCLSITPDDSIGVSRQIRTGRHDKTRNLLTIPKRVATAAQLGGAPVSYHSGKDRVVAIINRMPRFSDVVEVYNVTSELMTRWKTGLYAFQIPKEIHDHVHPGDTVWFWYDVLGDGFVMVLNPDEEEAPDGSVKLNVQTTKEAKSDYLIHLPKQICDALEISGASMKWGHDGERILGLLE